MIIRKCLIWMVLVGLFAVGGETGAAQGVAGETASGPKTRKTRSVKRRPRAKSQSLLPYMEQSAIVKKAKNNAASRRRSSSRRRK